MTLADILIPLAGSISNEKALKMREACDLLESRVDINQRGTNHAHDLISLLTDRVKELERDNLDRRLTKLERAVDVLDRQRVETLNLRVNGLEHTKDRHKRILEFIEYECVSPLEDRVSKLESATKNTGEGSTSQTGAVSHSQSGGGSDGTREPARSARIDDAGTTQDTPSPASSVPAPATGEVPAWIPSVEEMLELIDDGREGDLISLIAIRAPAQPSVEGLAERVEALERANGGYVLAKPEDVDARVAQAARAGLAEMMSALRVLVREEIAASAKNTGDAEASTASTAQRPPEVAGAAPASPAPDEVEALARELQRAWHAGSGGPASEWSGGYLAEERYVLSRYEPRGAKASASAVPMTHPASKTLNECREVFRRVAKRGPCLSSPDLHGIAAVRDFLTLSPEKFRENWGPRDEGDDEKCEGGEDPHGASAKNTGEGEVEHAASVSRSVSAKDASRATTPNNAEEGASAMRHGSGARPDATSLSTACPLCHGMLSEDECKKQNTPSPQGSTASAERSVRVDVVHANDGTPLMAAAHVAQPLTGGEGVLSWVPSVKELDTLWMREALKLRGQDSVDSAWNWIRRLIASRYVEWRAAHLVEEPGFDKGWDAAKRRFDERAPRASTVSVEEMAERLLNAQLKHYGLSPRAWAQVDEEERAYWLALARAAIGGGG